MARQGWSGVLLELNAQAPGETLPTCIKERLESRRRPAITLEAIHARLQRAARKRQEVQERQQPSRARKVASSPPSEEERAARLARELQERLDAAEAARAAAFNARQRRAAAAAKRAAAVRAAVEARAAEDARQREAALNARLSRAAAMRWASLAAKVSSQPESPSQFLQQHAAKRAAHRRERAATQLQRFWRKVVSGGATSRQLAAAFAATGLPEGPVIPTGAARQQRPSQAPRSPARRPGFGFITIEADENEESEDDPFDTMADLLHAPATLSAAGALLRRLEARLQACASGYNVSGGDSTKELAGAGGTGSSYGSIGDVSNGGSSSYGSTVDGSGGGKPMKSPNNPDDAAITAALACLFPRAAAARRRVPRYPTRVFLASYMIREHAMAVFNTWGERERRLAASARCLSAAMDALVAALLAPRPHGGAADCHDVGSMGSGCAFGGTEAAASSGDISGGDGSAGGIWSKELAAFDGAWAEYVGLFAAWKGRDAAALEKDLICAAVELERSMLRKLLPLGGLGSGRVAANEDLQILVHHVGEDQALLRSKCLQLRGAAGAARMDAALSAARAEEEARHADAVAAEAAQNDAPAPQGPSTPPRPVPVPPRLRAHPPAAPPQLQQQRIIDPAQQQRDAMLWELLHDAHWQLPTAEVEAKWADATGATSVMTEPQPDAEDLAADPAAAVANVQRRVRRIAEQAFWDARAEALASAEPEAAAAAAEGFVTLLGDLGRQLADALPQDGGPVAERVAATLGADALRRRLGGLLLLDGPQGAQELLAVLQDSAVLLTELGAPARVEAAAAARAAIASELASAAGDRVAMAKVITKAVRLLAAQLQMLRLDAANAHLRMLSVSLSGGAIIRHARSRFLAAHGLPQEPAPSAAQLAAALPATAAWLAAAVGQLPAAEAALQQQGGGAPASAVTSSAASSFLPAAGSSNLPTALPVAPMRTGTAGLSASAAATAAAAAGNIFGGPALQPAPAARLVLPVGVRSWRAAVRSGLVALVAGQEPLGRGGSSLPETLEMEARRLAEAQAAYQRLLVGVAATLLLREHAVAARKTLPPGTQETAHRRLAVLLADPATRMPHIAAELAALAGSRGDAATEEAMRRGLQRLLARGSPGFRAISNNLTTALSLRLLLGGGGDSDAAAATALTRCGASAAAAEVNALAADLGRVAAISEAVHGDTYATLVAGT